MTKSEKEKLRRGLLLVMSDDGFDKGVAVLAELADMVYPAGRVDATGTGTDGLLKLASGPGQLFQASEARPAKNYTVHESGRVEANTNALVYSDEAQRAMRKAEVVASEAPKGNE